MIPVVTTLKEKTYFRRGEGLENADEQSGFFCVGTTVVPAHIIHCMIECYCPLQLAMCCMLHLWHTCVCQNLCCSVRDSAIRTPLQWLQQLQEILSSRLFHATTLFQFVFCTALFFGPHQFYFMAAGLRAATVTLSTALLQVQTVPFAYEVCTVYPFLGSKFVNVVGAPGFTVK